MRTSVTISGNVITAPMSADRVGGQLQYKKSVSQGVSGPALVETEAR